MSKAQTWDEALRTLAQPVPAKYIKQKPGQGSPDYIPHHIIRQYLHGVLDWHSFRPAELHKKAEDEYAVRLELHASVGGEVRVFSGWGESENKKAPIKSAESDAVKRIAAMDLGLGLHLWSREHYFLPKALEQDVGDAAEEAAQRDATYGGDGDEATDESEAEQPQLTQEETVPEMSPQERASLRSKFFGIIQGMSLNYEQQVRPWMQAHYDGTSLSELGPKDFRALVAKLDPANQADRQENRKRFKAAVTEWCEANLEPAAT